MFRDVAEMLIIACETHSDISIVYMRLRDPFMTSSKYPDVPENQWTAQNRASQTYIKMMTSAKI